VSPDELAAHARALVDQAPPLTAAQREKLAQLFRPRTAPLPAPALPAPRRRASAA